MFKPTPVWRQLLALLTIQAGPFLLRSRQPLGRDRLTVRASTYKSMRGMLLELGPLVPLQLPSLPLVKLEQELGLLISRHQRFRLRFRRRAEPGMPEVLLQMFNPIQVMLRVLAPPVTPRTL